MSTAVETEFEVDFSIAPPCQHRQHSESKYDEKAAYIIRTFCPGCTETFTLLMCAPCYEYGLNCWLECEDCEYVGLPSEMWMVVHVL